MQMTEAVLYDVSPAIGACDWAPSAPSGRTPRAGAEDLRGENARLKRELRNKNEKLSAYARQIEALNRAISGSLRQPLRAVGDLMEALSQELADVLDEPALRCFDALRRATEQTDKTIDTLLDVSETAIVEVKRESLDLATVAREIVLDLSWNRRGRPIGFGASESTIVNGDAPRLRVLMTVLLEAAWKRAAGEARGCVRFTAYDGDHGEKIYSVSDNASDDDDRESAIAGTQLALASKILKEHGGRLWSQSVEGGGRAICFTLG